MTKINPRLGPQKLVPVPSDAVWLSSSQVLARYGGRSAMWLWRKVHNDPAFPRPTYFGRMQFFRRDELEDFERISVARSLGNRRESAEV